MYPVITISREFGSGGHSIGEKVAAKLGIPFYDGEIVTRVAEESGYAKNTLPLRIDGLIFPLQVPCIFKVHRMKFSLHKSALF